MDEKIITVDISKSKFLRANPQWKYNYGQKLKFEGVQLPSYYQVHFSNSIDGEAKTQIGDSTGVEIPPEYFIPGQSIFAWIYVTDEDSGVTLRQVEIPIHKKALVTDQEITPHEQTVIDETIAALNDTIEDIPNQITASLIEAKESGIFNGKDGSTIWTSEFAPIAPNYTFNISGLSGTPDSVIKQNDLILYDIKIYKIKSVGESTVLADFYVELKDLNALNKNGDEMFGVLNMGLHKIINVAAAQFDDDAVNLKQVKEIVAEGTSSFRGNFVTKTALLAVNWQSTNPSGANYVDNNDFAIVQADETHNNECWRYVYVKNSGWAEQYRINEAPLTSAQMDAINSGITSEKVSEFSEAGENIGDLEELETTEKSSLVAAVNEVIDKIPSVTFDSPNNIGKRIVVKQDGETHTQWLREETIYVASIDDLGIISWGAGGVPTTQEINGTHYTNQSIAVILTDDDKVVRLELVSSSFVKAIFAGAGFGTIYTLTGESLNSLGNTSRTIWTLTKASITNPLPQGGTTGQVLAKSSDEDYEVEWITPSGGGEITVDSALSDVSENPVQNKVIKEALDQKGTYSKPSGGIPASDLEEEYLTSEDLNGYATESWVNDQGFLKTHQSLEAYRTAADQDAIDSNFAHKDIIVVDSAQPSSETNVLWVNTDSSQAIEIPTWSEFEEGLGGKISDPKQKAVGAALIYNGTKWVASASDMVKVYTMAVSTSDGEIFTTAGGPTLVEIKEQVNHHRVPVIYVDFVEESPIIMDTPTHACLIINDWEFTGLELTKAIFSDDEYTLTFSKMLDSELRFFQKKLKEPGVTYFNFSATRDDQTGSYTITSTGTKITDLWAARKNDETIVVTVNVNGDSKEVLISSEVSFVMNSENTPIGCFVSFGAGDFGILQLRSIGNSWELGFIEFPVVAEDVGAIAAPASASAGQFLVYDGSAWTAQTLATWQGGSY